MEQIEFMNQPITNFKSVVIYFYGIQTCPSEHSFGPAVRNHYLLHFVLEGCGIFVKDGKTYYLKKGDAFLIRPNELTYYQADKMNPWEYAWVAFDGFDVELMMKQCGFNEQNPVYDMEERGGSLENRKEILNRFSHPAYNEYELIGYFYSLISTMVLKEQKIEQNSRKVYCTKALEYMKHNYPYPVKVTDIAAFVGIDRTYLYKIFMEELSISPQKYLMNLRLSAAAEMLKSTEYNITEITYSCGFLDASSFCKQFKLFYAMSPLKYRKWIMK